VLSAKGILMIHIISMAVQGGTVVVVGDKTRKGWRKLETFIPLYYSRKRVAMVLRELANKLEKV
jgi:hypothetical protein